MNNPGDVNRPYSSPLRQAQAKETRLAIIRAAQKLFVDVGFAATSVDAIARQAGVARATVFTSVGGKPALMKAAYDVAVVGDDEPIPLPERPWAQSVRTAETQERLLDAYAWMMQDVCARVAPIYEALRGAATIDSELAGLFADVRQQRRVGAANIITMLLAKGPIRPSLTLEEAGDVLWVLNDPGLYALLVLDRGWSGERYSEWLASATKRELLGQPW